MMQDVNFGHKYTLLKGDLMELKSIETVYNNYRFRSRLEARWAVYFDTMGIMYEYEKEGYDLGFVGKYLPDFWLPQVNMWAEVKPQEFTTEEKNKAIKLAIVTGYPVIKLIGLPDYVTYKAYLPSLHETDFLLSNYHGYLVSEHRFYSGTEFFGKPKNVMQNGVYELDGESIKKGIIASKSVRFEFDEKQECKTFVKVDPELERTIKELKRKQLEKYHLRQAELKRKQDEESNKTFCGSKNIGTENKYDSEGKLSNRFIIRSVMEKEFQICLESIRFIRNSSNPEKTLEYILSIVTDDTVIIDTRTMDLSGFNEFVSQSISQNKSTHGGN